MILLWAAALCTTDAFTPATRSAAVAGVALERAAGFEVVAHGLVALMAFGAAWKSNFGRPTPSARRASVAASARWRGGVAAMAWRFHAIDATLSP